MEDFVWPEWLWSERVNCQLIEVIYSKFKFRVKQFVFSSLCYVCECTGSCQHALVFPTSVGDRSVLIQSDQRGVQQDRVHVLCDHAMVRCLDPRLVLVDCGERRDRRGKAIICLRTITRIWQPLPLSWDSASVRRTERKAETPHLRWCRAFVCDGCAGFFIPSSAGRTANGSLGVTEKWFSFNLTWLVWLWKVSLQNIDKTPPKGKSWTFLIQFVASQLPVRV